MDKTNPLSVLEEGIENKCCPCGISLVCVNRSVKVYFSIFHLSKGLHEIKKIDSFSVLSELFFFNKVLSLKSHGKYM